MVVALFDFFRPVPYGQQDLPDQGTDDVSSALPEAAIRLIHNSSI